MKSQSKKILHYGLTGTVGIIFIGSALSKFFGGQETIQMAESIGLRVELFRVLGGIELLSILLFIFPRTGVIGTLLLIAYMGGAIAVHLTHGQSIIVPLLIEVLIGLVALLRFPELKTQLLRTQVS